MLNEKRGWVRIIEASLSITIILGVLFYIYFNTATSEDSDLSEKARGVLEEAALNSTMRSAIIRQDSLIVNTEVERLLNDKSLSFETRICEIESACGKSSFTEGNVYSAERVISVALPLGEEGKHSKKIRLFIWREIS